ncbi:MAG TPA: KTSC domain-containing protein [Gallionellaceae bacterium]|jgi:hypothetical protein|nr:KTSC domain-containing protein [Gallionellaceae bacterium]
MKYLQITLSNGQKWGVPVEMIAWNRAKHYAGEFDGDIKRSLEEDTLPLFENSPYDVQDWAVGNMNWSDFDGHQIKIADAPAPNFQAEWMSGQFEVIERVEITMTPCTNSSQVIAHGYDAATSTLAVQYKNGGTYHYKAVPAKLYEELLAAESAGKFIHAEVKSVYEFVKMPEVTA